MNFTVEEINLICIYWGNTRTKVVEKIQNACSVYKNEPELLDVMNSTVRKLKSITDDIFLEVSFYPTYPVLCDEIKGILQKR